MNRSDPLWGQGPEYEKPDHDERMERLTQMEMQTRILENNTDMLLALIERFKQ
jgi:hypothetical protein